MAKVLTHKQTRHGYGGTPVYKLWGSMIKRCEIKSSPNYKYYGGRGIKVFEEWRNNPKSFCEWALANGYAKGLELDRVNRDGDYTPENCRFITHAQNCAPFKRVFKNNKTGHTGVSISKNGNYEVFVRINGKQIYCGVRKTIEEALELRNSVIGNIHDKTPQQ